MLRYFYQQDVFICEISFIIRQQALLNSVIVLIVKQFQEGIHIVGVYNLHNKLHTITNIAFEFLFWGQRSNSIIFT